MDIARLGVQIGCMEVLELRAKSIRPGALLVEAGS